MTPKEIKALIKTLRSCGVLHYKTPELELNLTPLVPRETKPAEEETTEIKHKVEELTSLLKLSDKDLVDRLFPDTTEDDGEESTDNTN